MDGENERRTPCPAGEGLTAETRRRRAAESGRSSGAALERRIFAKTERRTPCPAGEVGAANERGWVPVVEFFVGAPPCEGPCSGTAGRPHGVAPMKGREIERWTPCPAGTAARWTRRARARRRWVRASRKRARPSSVRGPVLRPPWSRQRPFFMAGSGTRRRSAYGRRSAERPGNHRRGCRSSAGRGDRAVASQA